MTDTTRRDHLLIAGTGRAGTSFLVRYLTGIGMDTHLARNGDAAYWDEDANAGLEDMPLINPPLLPYVIKTPWTFEFITELLSHPAIRLRAAIVPVRDLREAAASRTIVERRAIHSQTNWMADHDTLWENWAYTAGGVVVSLTAIDQARLLAVGFHHVVQQLVSAEVPLLLLAFPRLVEDADYLFNSLRAVLPAETTIEAAREVHQRTADRSKVRVHAVSGASTSLSGPSEEELDRQALKRELVRLRSALNVTEGAARSAETEIQGLRHDLETLRAASPSVVAPQIAAEPAPATMLTRLRRIFLP